MKLTDEMRMAMAAARKDWIVRANGQTLDESLFLAGYRFGLERAARECDAECCNAARVSRCLRSLIEDANG